MSTVNQRILPGFRLSLGYTLCYLSFLVLIPLAACFLKSTSLSFEQFWNAVWTERARAAYRLTFGASLAAAALNVVLGGLSLDGKTAQVLYSAVSGNYFLALGIQPAAGRLFLPGEGEAPGRDLGLTQQ